MNFSLSWLPQVVGTAGLVCIEQPGWLMHGRAEMGDVRGVLCHHTAGPYSGDAPSIDIVTKGRPDLKGPLAQIVLGRSGKVYLIAAGRANHAGSGSWHGVTDGNAHFIGIEAENAGYAEDVWNTSDGLPPGKTNLGRVTKDGKQPYIIHKADPWPAVQRNAYARLCAAILNHVHAPVIMCVGHKEYALPKGRKSDPAFDMDAFRLEVSKFMSAPSH